MTNTTTYPQYVSMEHLPRRHNAMTSPNASDQIISQRTADLLRYVVAPTVPALLDALKADGWDVEA